MYSVLDPYPIITVTPPVQFRDKNHPFRLPWERDPLGGSAAPPRPLLWAALGEAQLFGPKLPLDLNQLSLAPGMLQVDIYFHGSESPFKYYVLLPATTKLLTINTWKCCKLTQVTLMTYISQSESVYLYSQSTMSQGFTSLEVRLVCKYLTAHTWFLWRNLGNFLLVSLLHTQVPLIGEQHTHCPLVTDNAEWHWYCALYLPFSRLKDLTPASKKWKCLLLTLRCLLQSACKTTHIYKHTIVQTHIHRGF